MADPVASDHDRLCDLEFRMARVEKVAGVSPSAQELANAAGGALEFSEAHSQLLAQLHHHPGVIGALEDFVLACGPELLSLIPVPGSPLLAGLLEVAERALPAVLEKLR